MTVVAAAMWAEDSMIAGLGIGGWSRGVCDFQARLQGRVSELCSSVGSSVWMYLIHLTPRSRSAAQTGSATLIGLTANISYTYTAYCYSNCSAHC